MKMLVTQGLNELKTLDSRIMKEISNAKFVCAAKTSEKKVTPSKTKEEFIEKARADYQSICDLIDRREKIKNAIVESNANTMVEICGQTLSVAKIIDMKSSIEYKAKLLDAFQDSYNESVVRMNRENVNMESKIDQLVTTAFGKESKSNIKEDDYDAIAKPYRVANEFSLVDPLGAEVKIKELDTFIEEFLSTVDSKLQVSNCTTWIEV